MKSKKVEKFQKSTKELKNFYNVLSRVKSYLYFISNIMKIN
jgi:hypothetical protein